MNILAFDTSTEVLSVVVLKGDLLAVDINLKNQAKHSEDLIPTLSEAMRKAEITLKDLDCIAVGLGPGSFTGLRIGVMVAKTLAYSLGKKLVGISSLEAVARESDFEGRIAVASAAAKRGQVYAAFYEKKRAEFKMLKKPTLMAVDEFLKNMKEPKLMVGNGVFPKAAFIAESALSLIRKKKFIDPFKLEPLYIYPRDCNVTRKK